MQKKIFSLLLLLLIMSVAASCKISSDSMRAAATPSEATVNMLMSVDSNDFDNFKTYLHKNLSTTVTTKDFEVLQSIIKNQKYSVKTYTIVKFGNGEMFIIRFSDSKEDKDKVMSISKLSKDIADKLDNIYSDNTMTISVNE